jgi:hypothetical protein
MRGVGQVPTAPEPYPSNGTAAGIGLGLGLGILAFVVGASLLLNYQVGKAMAPSKDKIGTYGWGNAFGGTFIPLFTPGMAIYRNIKYPR